jgi:hypothetical protein
MIWRALRVRTPDHQICSLVLHHAGNCAERECERQESVKVLAEIRWRARRAEHHDRRAHRVIGARQCSGGVEKYSSIASRLSALPIAKVPGGGRS